QPRHGTSQFSTVQHSTALGTVHQDRYNQHCTCPSPNQAATYYIIAGGNCPVSGRIWDTAECESAVASLGITASPRTEGTTGTWDWTPPGCWIRFGGTQWAVTITNASANNGQYRAICREPTPAPTAAPTPALLP
ncbi:unnamed protein product, partial [Prorocentrum cordatum]